MVNFYNRETADRLEALEALRAPTRETLNRLSAEIKIIEESLRGLLFEDFDMTIVSVGRLTWDARDQRLWFTSNDCSYVRRLVEHKVTDRIRAGEFLPAFLEKVQTKLEGER